MAAFCFPRQYQVRQCSGSKHNRRNPEDPTERYLRSGAFGTRQAPPRDGGDAISTKFPCPGHAEGFLCSGDFDEDPPEREPKERCAVQQVPQGKPAGVTATLADR
jgi:hypothetical protein